MWGVAVWGLILQPLFQGRLKIDLYNITALVSVPAGLLPRHLKPIAGTPKKRAKRSHNGLYKSGMRTNIPRNLHEHSSN